MRPLRLLVVGICLVGLGTLAPADDTLTDSLFLSSADQQPMKGPDAVAQLKVEDTDGRLKFYYESEPQWTDSFRLSRRNTFILFSLAAVAGVLGAVARRCRSYSD